MRAASFKAASVIDNGEHAFPSVATATAASARSPKGRKKAGARTVEVGTTVADNRNIGSATPPSVDHRVAESVRMDATPRCRTSVESKTERHAIANAAHPYGRRTQLLPVPKGTLTPALNGHNEKNAYTSASRASHGRIPIHAKGRHGRCTHRFHSHIHRLAAIWSRVGAGVEDVQCLTERNHRHGTAALDRWAGTRRYLEIMALKYLFDRFGRRVDGLRATAPC